MGKRNFVRRESKKPKKDAKKILPVTVLQPSENVEVIKKGKKEEAEEEES